MSDALSPAEPRSESSARDERSSTDGSSIELLDDDIAAYCLYSSAFTDFADMASSKYTVTFNGIRETYAADSAIVCRYVDEDGERQPDDAIHIKKIGWKEDELQTSLVAVSASDAVFDTPAGNILKVTFSPDLFSGRRTGDDLFQFCYISGSLLRGASVPFSIIRPKEDDYASFAKEEEVNDDYGFVVLKSPQAQMQEKIEQLQTELNTKEEKNKFLSEKVLLLEEERCKLNQALDSTVTEARQKTNEMEQSLDESCQRVVRLRNDVVSLKADLDTEKKKMQEMQKAFQETSDELTIVRGKNAELRKDLGHLLHKKRDDEEFRATHGVRIEALKNELRALEREKSAVSNDAAVARASLESVRNALETESVLRKREREESKANEDLLKRKVDEFKLRLEDAAAAYEEKYKYSVKLEGKLQRLQQKVNQFLAVTKTRSPSDPVAIPLQMSAVVGVAPAALAAAVGDEAAAAVPANVSGGGKEADIVSLPCSICCEDVICTDLRPMSAHLETEHQQLVCPVCSQMFDKSIPGIDSYFHCHVENHFDAARHRSSS